MNLSVNQKNIRQRLLELIHEARTSHIGSCITAIDIIDAIYTVKKKHEKFILSNGHAAAALYIILEKHKIIRKANLQKLGAHPDRRTCKKIDLSTGSLGQGLPVAVGIALANRKKNAYCLISDGECTEGSIWEAVRLISEMKITNLKLLVNANGWGAYDKIDIDLLKKRFRGFNLTVKGIDGHNEKQLISALKAKNTKPTIIFAMTTNNQLPFLSDLDAHYYVMNDEDFLIGTQIYQ